VVVLFESNVERRSVMSNQSLKQLALTFKILAIFVSVVIGLWLLHPRWGVNRVADVQLVGLAVLSLIPNRWLVFSRTSFVLFLLLTLFPFEIFFHISAYRDFDWRSIIVMPMAFFVYGPLPLSLILSRIRFKRGEKFIFV
jgi:hypothetical protein